MKKYNVEDSLETQQLKVSTSTPQKLLEKEITRVLLTIGIPANIRGFQFLREAVKMVVENTEHISITKDLYPSVALRFNTTPNKAQRAIRNALDVAWTRGHFENINMIFGYTIYTKNDKPKNGEFIALVADMMQMGLSA